MCNSPHNSNSIKKISCTSLTTVYIFYERRSHGGLLEQEGLCPSIQRYHSVYTQNILYVILTPRPRDKMLFVNLVHTSADKHTRTHTHIDITPPHHHHPLSFRLCLSISLLRGDDGCPSVCKEAGMSCFNWS